VALDRRDRVRPDRQPFPRRAKPKPGASRIQARIWNDPVVIPSCRTEALTHVIEGGLAGRRPGVEALRLRHLPESGLGNPAGRGQTLERLVERRVAQ